jgi:thiol-disulfide isomerase/thioredoxin
VFGGLFTWALLQPKKYSQYDPMSFIGANDDNGQIADHVRGEFTSDAPITIVEWGDFSCSHCASENPTFKAVAEAFPTQVNWIYRNFPLNGYPNSISAASAVEAAGFQGFYWEMADAMFANQATWYNLSASTRVNTYVDIFLRAAPSGDGDRLRADILDDRISQKINFDRALGANFIGQGKPASGTPAVFLNGQLLSGESMSSEAKFRSFIEQKLTELGIDFAINEDDTTSED